MFILILWIDFCSILYQIADQVMKYTVCFLLFILVAFQSCMPLMEQEDTISFWTDMDLDSNKEYVLLINDVLVGKFERSIDEVSCGDAWLIDIPLENEDDMNLSLKVDTEEITEIGMINLYGVSNGIKVKSNYEGALFVQHDIDESCTRVRVRW